MWSLVGIAMRFLARGGVPHRRRQAVAKIFELDAPLRSAWRTLKTLQRECAGVAIAIPPQISVRLLLETSNSYGFPD